MSIMYKILTLTILDIKNANSIISYSKAGSFSILTFYGLKLTVTEQILIFLASISFCISDILLPFFYSLIKEPV